MTAAALASGDSSALPRQRWWWLCLALLLILAGWLYLRGYDVSLPYIEHHDEAQNLLEAQHIIDFGHARGVFREAYPPGLRTVIYPFLKHIKPEGAHQGTMLPALRLITIAVWLGAVALIALLGALTARPLTGLMAAAIWIVNPWVVQRAHWVLPDGYNTFFTLLALLLALISYRQGRRSFNTAAVYSLMLAIVFKTQAIFVAPCVLLLPLLHWRRGRAWQQFAWQQSFWNCLRFAIFLFWLLLIYPTLEAPQNIYRFPVTELRFVLPTPELLWTALTRLLLLVFAPISAWLLMAAGGGLLWRYRQRVDGVALLVIALSAAAWLVGTHLLPTRGFSERQYFGMGALLAILFASGLTGWLFFLAEAQARFAAARAVTAPPLASAAPALLLLTLLALGLLPMYRQADALARNYTLQDRRNNLMTYMDTSLPPGKYIADRDGPFHKVFNVSWGGYTGRHDYPLARTLRELEEKSLESWRENDAIYAIMPYPAASAVPHSYFPEDTVLLKSYPPDPNFRDPGMMVLRLYPMQYRAAAQLGPIHLVGYDLNTKEAAPGDALTLRHYWQAESPTLTTHHVYNHLLDAAGTIVAQTDYVPLWDARRPTTTWDDPAEILLGRQFTLALSADLPPGKYRLVSGLYDVTSWQRLLAPGGRDFIDITEIAVAAAGS